MLSYSKHLLEDELKGIQVIEKLRRLGTRLLKRKLTALYLDGLRAARLTARGNAVCDERHVPRYGKADHSREMNTVVCRSANRPSVLLS